jgi:hypothetical protein
LLSAARELHETGTYGYLASAVSGDDLEAALASGGRRENEEATSEP